MKTYRMKGNNVGIINTVLIYFFIFLLILLPLLNAPKLVLFSVVFGLTCLRAFFKYNKSVRLIEVNENEILFYKKEGHIYDRVLRDGFLFSFKRRSINILKRKGGDIISLKRKNWDKEQGRRI